MSRAPATELANTSRCFGDLENPICDAADFARVADFVAARVFGDVSTDESTMLMPWQVELILFTGLQAKLAAERAEEAFRASAEAAS